MRKRKLREKKYLHGIVFDMFLLVPYPAFVAPWCPASTYWGGGGGSYGSFLQALSLQWDAFPWGTAGLATATTAAPASGIKALSHEYFLMDLGFFAQLHLTTFLGEPPWLEPLQGANEVSLTCPCLQDTTGRKIYYPACFCYRKIFLLLHLLFTISIFFSKQLQKIWFRIPAFACKIRRGKKKAARKHGHFDLETHQNSLGSTDSPIVPGFVSADSLSRKVLLWPSTAGSGVVWWQSPGTPRRLF